MTEPSGVNLTAADPSHVVAELALMITAEGDVIRGRSTVVPEACVTGTDSLRTSVILTWADIIAGAVAGLAISPRIPLTLDLEVLVRKPFPVGSAVVAEASLVRAGRSVTVTEATFGDGSDPEPFAVVVATFVPSPDESHVFPNGFPLPAFPEGNRLSAPFAERVGCRQVEPGIVEVPRRPDGLNAVGAMQGGVVALALEEAAATVSPEPTHLESLNVRYLRPVMVGPARAVATAAGALRTVRLTDTATGKLCALATARVARKL